MQRVLPFALQKFLGFWLGFSLRDMAFVRTDESLKVWKWVDAELEGSVLGQNWAGIYSPREFSWHLQAELGLILQPSADLGLPWDHSVWGV